MKGVCRVPVTGFKGTSSACLVTSRLRAGPIHHNSEMHEIIPYLLLTEPDSLYALMYNIV